MPKWVKQMSCTQAPSGTLSTLAPSSVVQPSPTTGGALVQFIGTGFVAGVTVVATYSNLDGVNYTAMSCAVDPSATTITCYTIPDYGAALSSTISVSGVVALTSLTSGLITSYRAPVISSVT